LLIIVLQLLPQTKGYCPWYGKPCRTFPVVIGETGSFMHDSKDITWMNVSCQLQLAAVCLLMSVPGKTLWQQETPARICLRNS
jgi:hypothetical protein